MTDKETWRKWLSKLAERYSAAFLPLIECAKQTDREYVYPAEANAVAALASLIAAPTDNPSEGPAEGSLAYSPVVLEAQYWHQEINENRETKHSYCDIWRKEPELFVEVKLAQLTGNRLGTQTGKTIVSYAYDVWRLLALAARQEARTECAFVVVAFGDELPDVRPVRAPRAHPNALAAYDAIRVISGEAPLKQFLDTAGERVGAEVMAGAPVPIRGGKNRFVRCYASRWVLESDQNARDDDNVEVYEPR